MAMWSSHNLSRKIYCTFTRKDKTVIHKWIRVDTQGRGRVEFDNGWYYYTPAQVILESYNKGIHAVLPTNIRTLYFKYDTKGALDPATHDDSWLTPQMFKNLSKQNDVESLNRGSEKALKTSKQGASILGGGWLPIILIVGIVAIGYLVWKQQSMVNSLGMQSNVMQQQMLDIMNQLKNMK